MHMHMEPVMSDKFEVDLKFFYPWHTEQFLSVEDKAVLDNNLISVSYTGILYNLNDGFDTFNVWKDIMKRGYYITHEIYLHDKIGNVLKVVEVKCSVVKTLHLAPLDYSDNGLVKLVVELDKGPYYEIIYH